MSEQVIKKREAKRKDEIGQYGVFLGYKPVMKDKIVAAYDKVWLKNQSLTLLGFTYVMAWEALDELELKCHALAYTEKQAKLN